ncbi:MAG TPA: prephenate dehydrogenase/arogenate dehydrogenase family protein [bacterium]|nr:prephenate dehydrogenase/arogenate dehydrogenase family protein [bacterium]
MRPKKIAIVGLGLMGGSLAAACRRKFPSSRIIGISRNPKSLRYALKKKWIHGGTSSLSQGVSQADLVVLCSPVNTFVPLLSAINQAALPGTLVTDVGSAKGQVMKQIRKKKHESIKFVSAHPMVGSHQQGIHAADPFLYDKGITFVIREKNISPKSFRSITSFWQQLSKRIFAVTAEEHDKIVSEISHLPHVLAACLMTAVNDKFLPFAGTGFRDVTRVAQGDPSVWVPILSANQPAVRKALRALQRRIGAFERTLAERKKDKLRTFLQKAARRRKQI